MDKLDDKDLLEVNWLGQSEDIVNDMIGVNNTSRAMLVGVGVPVSMQLWSLVSST
jgi:hypothetical protein